ncbi:MAG: VWA domain-containing protein [Deltaproteobacteria bacterium]|nr:VWA domain-containing protein [Deltaproteobacteria bacterium]
MSFGRADVLIWLLLLPAAAWLLWRGEKQRRHRLSLVGGPLGQGSGVRLIKPMTTAKAGLLVFALLSLVLALAKPRWDFVWTDVKRHGSDIVIAVDVSQSMTAQDVSPSRIERAKHEILDLLPMLKGDRIGLVAFAGDAFVECPLTEDYGAVRMFVGFLGPDLIPLQGTDLAGAINTSLKALFDGSPGGTEGRAIILLTDGEDQEPNAEKAAATAKEKGVKLYAIGIGTPEGAPIPEPNGGFKKDAQGNMVITKPNETALSKLAASSGGVYARSVAGGGDLERIYLSGIRKQVAQREYQATREKLWFERFQWFVGAALVALVLEFLLRDVRLLAMVMVITFAGLRAPEAKASPLAELYNQSVARYRKGDFAGAARGFAAASDSTDQALAERALFNLGNTQVELGKLDEAIKAYENALALDPKDQEAKDNLEYVKKLKEQQQNQPQNENQNQPNSDHNQSDQQQNQQQNNQGQQNQQNQDQQQNSGQDQQKQNQDPNQESKQNQDPNKDPNKDPSGDQSQQGGKDEKKDEKKDDQGDQNDSGQRDGEEPQGGQDQEQQPRGGDSEERSGKGEIRAAPISPDEAEKVLRSVDDNPKKHLYGPKDKTPPRQKDKDW